MNKNLKLGLVIYTLGIIGILSLLTAEIPVPDAAKKMFSPDVLKVIVLVGPAINILIATIAGVLLYTSVNLKVPAIAGLLNIEQPSVKFSAQVKSGILFGIIAGALTTVVSLLFQSSIPENLQEMTAKLKPSLLARLLYGGITEEILMRFGVMTFLVWVAFKITRKLSPSVYWAGIIISSLLFALGHFPVVYQAVGNPSGTLLTYIIIGNSIAGLLFGWLYWKKGLEAAFVAHMFAHITMMSAEYLFGLQ